MRVPILERLASGEILIADGATGTMLQTAGLPVGTPGEAWILERPEEIMRLHRAYLEAGSQIILTSTFGGTRARLKHAGLDDQVVEINRRAAELACQMAGDPTTLRPRSGQGDVYIAGDLGPTGKMMAPLGKLTYETAVELFAEQAEALAAGGVDCLYIETMSDLNEARAAAQGAKQVCDLPVFCTSASIPTATPAWASAPLRRPRRWPPWGCRPSAPTAATPQRKCWISYRRCARPHPTPT